MNKHIIALAVIAAAAAPIGYGAPDLLDIHEQVSDKMRAAGRMILPAPLFELIDSVPPGTTPHERILRLAQADAPPPPAAPIVDPAAIADWANGLATITTQRTLDGLFPRGTPRKPVIVGGSSDAKTRVAMEEDLNVMMRILEKAVGGKDEARPTAGGIELFSFGKPSSPRVFYIEGHGAMFVLNVRYPLLAPPQKDDSANTNDQTNTEWEKARDEVYGRRTPLDDVKFNAGPAEEFDPQRVENLKQQIIDDLVNAKNIRGLKSDDSVTVVVLGGGTRATVVRREKRSTAGRGIGGYAAAEASASGTDSGTQTTLTLRVKKADIDALAKGKLDAQEFQKKVSAQVY
jgi:hypothetical protein